MVVEFQLVAFVNKFKNYERSYQIMLLWKKYAFASISVAVAMVAFFGLMILLYLSSPG